MPIVNTKQLEVGMVTASDVLDRSGRLLFMANTSLEEKHFRVLQTWGIHTLNIKGTGDEKDEIESDESDFELFEECRKEVTKRFILSNSSSPVSRELYRLCVRHTMDFRKKGR